MSFVALGTRLCTQQGGLTLRPRSETLEVRVTSGRSVPDPLRNALPNGRGSEESAYSRARFSAEVFTLEATA
jgi:hypothetical protein